MKVMQEEPRRFYDELVNITGSESVVYALFWQIFEHLKEEGFKQDLNSFINSLKNNNKIAVQAIIRDLEEHALKAVNKRQGISSTPLNTMET